MMLHQNNSSIPKSFLCTYSGEGSDLVGSSGREVTGENWRGKRELDLPNKTILNQPTTMSCLVLFEWKFVNGSMSKAIFCNLKL